MMPSLAPAAKPWCPACGDGSKGLCDRCLRPEDRVAVLEICPSRWHGRAEVCPECGTRRPAPSIGAAMRSVASGLRVPPPKPAPDYRPAAQRARESAEDAGRPAPASEPADPPEVIVFDTETTGKSREKDRVIQLSAAVVTLPGCEIVDQRTMLCSPGVDMMGSPISIPYGASRIHGLYDRDVTGKPALEAALPRFLAWARGRPLVAHNASFDRDFLRNAMHRAGIPWPGLEVFCTLKMARRALPALPSHALGTLAEHLRVSAEGAHRADRDVRITVAVLRGLLSLTGMTLRKLHGKADEL